MRYPLAVLKSPHVVLVGAGLEDDAHTGGVLCGTALASSDAQGTYLSLNDGVVYEAGQPAGQLSAGLQAKIGPPPTNGALAADVQTCKAFLAAASGTATAVQRDDAIKALMRITRRVVSELR